MPFVKTGTGGKTIQVHRQALQNEALCCQQVEMPNDSELPFARRASPDRMGDPNST